MQNITPEIIGGVITQLGLSVVFLWLMLRREKVIEDKDNRIRQQSDALLEAYRDNTRVNTELKTVINRSSAVTDKIYEALIKK